MHLISIGKYLHTFKFVAMPLHSLVSINYVFAEITIAEKNTQIVATLMPQND